MSYLNDKPDAEEMRRTLKEIADLVCYSPGNAEQLIRQVRDKMRALDKCERRVFRLEKLNREVRRQVDACIPWIGVCPPAGTQEEAEMLAVRRYAAEIAEED